VRILILSFYYHPDLSAGSFRTTALVEALRKRAPAGTSIDVVTTLPNRYRTFNEQAGEDEEAGAVRIRRIRLPSHRSDMKGQSRAFLHFAVRARALVADQRYDLVFATSSRLMTASLGAWIASQKSAPLYLDIRDIFVDTIGDLLRGPAAWIVRAVFSRLERWTFRRASRINLVSRGFEQYFRQRYPDASFAWFTNGIDDEFIEPADGAPADREANGSSRATILYAGNLGEGQCLHDIMPQLAVALRERARFVVIGDGGRRSQLEAALTNAGADNVELRMPMPRSSLLAAYRASDVLFLHLGPYAAFEKVLPSKLFEYGALGKPVLAGVGGYAARFVREEISNSAVFAPCSVQEAVAAFGSLKIEPTKRPEFIRKFARANIASAMADDILQVAANGMRGDDKPALEMPR
jgi:glycosyltransferase involved in cell wall biosynthesis